MYYTMIPHASDDSPHVDLPTALFNVLAHSTKPLTTSKIRALLPPPLNTITLKRLADQLHRLVALDMLTQFPKYRSRQDRFWDRPMQVHLRDLLLEILQHKPLSWSVIHRKLPDYAKPLGAGVLQYEVAQGRIHRHPPPSPRGGFRFGLQPADPKTYLRTEFIALFKRLEKLGFTQSQLFAAATDLLQAENRDNLASISQTKNLL